MSASHATAGSAPGTSKMPEEDAPGSKTISAAADGGAEIRDRETPAPPPRGADPPPELREQSPDPEHHARPARENRPDREPRPVRDAKSGRGTRHDQRPEARQPRPDRMIDARELSEKAWQLFAGEVREEGIELINDSDAEKLTHRCLRLAEIFLRTRQRRITQIQQGISSPPDDRRRDESRSPSHRPERPPPAVTRIPDDPEEVSREQAEALIERAHEAAATGALDLPTPPDETSQLPR
jgi:hypothetical protein